MMWGQLQEQMKIIMLSEVSQRKIYDVTYKWNLKNDTDEFTTKQIVAYRKQTYGYQKRNRAGEG